MKSKSEMPWNKTPIETEKLNTFQQTYHLDPLLATVLFRRQIYEPSELIFFLENDLHYLHNAFLLHDIIPAIERSWQAITREEKILVFGDRDVDGVSSTVLLVEGLRQLGAEPLWLNLSGKDSSTFSSEHLEWAKEQGVSLLFTVDCGGSSVAEVVLAQKLGIDVIVLDHHLPAAKLPAALALVNPRLGNYPFPEISSAVVVGKFLWALGFSKSTYYGKELTLLYLSCDQEGRFWAELAKVINLKVLERHCIRLDTDIAKSEFLKKINQLELFGFDLEEQQAQAEIIFGDDVILRMVDLAVEFRQHFPQLEQLSLAKLSKNSRAARYQTQSMTDTLINISKLLLLRNAKLAESLLLQSLDLMMLSTLADMMPVRNENRLIVQQGLLAINRKLRPGLRELLVELELLQPPFKTELLSRQVIPLLNAAGKLGFTEVASALFLSPEVKVRRDCAQQLKTLNQRRRKLTSHFWTLLLAQAKQVLPDFSGKLILLHCPDIPRGLTGALAARLSQFFHIPAIVITTEAKGNLSASIRSPSYMSILPLLEGAADLYSDYGGHPSAGGFCLPIEQLSALRRRYHKLIHLVGSVEIASWSIDIELASALLQVDVLERVVKKLAPFGHKNPAPLFLTKGMELVKIEAFGSKKKSHLRLVLKNGTKQWTAIFWNAVEQYSGELNVDEKIDVLYQMEVYSYGGGTRIQLVIQDIRASVSSEKLSDFDSAGIIDDDDGSTSARAN